MKILFTNFNMINYSGSEIDTLSIANYFFSNGYSVDIFTLKKGFPLMGKINKKIRVITLAEIHELYLEYDIIWSHHYPLLDYLLFVKKIKSKHICYFSLSPYEPYESLPVYHDKLSLICGITNEVNEKLLLEGVNKKKLRLFPNYATEDFFNYNNKKTKIEKICIVSNHVPKELVKIKDIFEKDNIFVDIYGKNYKREYVDSLLLSKYDVVISIGKTVYYALAMKIPVYCYDHFGGYGYIDSKNIEKAYKYNFSGRSFGKKLSSKEICDDIKNNFSRACNDLEKLREFSYKHFNLGDNIDNLLKEIKGKKVNFEELEKLYPLYERRSRLFVEQICNLMYSEDNNFTINYYKNKYEELISSTSWRLTKPIRKFKELIFKLRK